MSQAASQAASQAKLSRARLQRESGAKKGITTKMPLLIVRIKLKRM